MSKTAERAKKSDNLFTRLKTYLKETRAEIGRVIWPTRDQALRLTGIVLGVTAALAAVLALVDWLFAWFVSQVLVLNWVVIGAAAALIAAGLVWWFLIRRRRVGS